MENDSPIGFSVQSRRIDPRHLVAPKGETMQGNITPPIVVGIDGSTGSVEALRWAAAEARLRGASLRAVLAWEYPYAYGGLSGVYVVPTEQIEKDSATTLEAIISQAIPDASAAKAVERVIVPGHPSSQLIEQSKDAALLVVGARGHGGFIGLLVGSTSDQVVKHAECPVVVIHERPTEQ
jgi:nucleotide-binding universal stress UspA family protein